MKIKTILLFTLFIFIGCENKKEPNIEMALSEVISKFPQLAKGGINHYQFVKSIKNGKYNFEIQLYSEPDNIKDPQKIIVLINSKKECYAIPFFSNTYKDYWEFRNEKKLQSSKKAHTSFTKQYIEALNFLNINTSKICYVLTNDIVVSLLSCDRITKNNSHFLKDLVFLNNNVSSESYESGKELKEKALKNYEEITNTNNSDLNFNYNQIPVGYLDYNNYRFYQIVYKYKYAKHPNKNGQQIITKKLFQIKSYRYDTKVSMMSSSF
jgi:hypothetical protein